MSHSNPVGQNSQGCCALPTPAKWAGGIISLTALVGFGAAAYLGKLDRKVALLGAGLSGVSLVVFGAIPRKGAQVEKREENTPVPQQEAVALAYSPEYDTLQKLLDAINGCETEGVLDLSEMPDEERFFEEGKLLLAIANHETLTKVKWGDKKVGIEKVDSWAYQLRLNVPQNQLSRYLDRTDSILLPSLEERFAVLLLLNKRENIERVHLQDKDHDAILKRTRNKLWQTPPKPLDLQESAFLKLQSVIDDGSDPWHLGNGHWPQAGFEALIDGCPRLKELRFSVHSRGKKADQVWTDARAQKVGELLDRGVTVTLPSASYYVFKNRDNRNSAQFKVAARLITTLEPKRKSWTPELIEQVIPLATNLQKVVIHWNQGKLFTRNMLTRLKEAGMKELKVIGNNTLSADDIVWIMTDLEVDKFTQEQAV